MKKIIMNSVLALLLVATITSTTPKTSSGSNGTITTFELMSYGN